MIKKYSPQQVKFINDNVRGRTTSDLAKLFNANFERQVTASKMKSFLSNHGLRNGVNYKFKKGHTPANKGKKGLTTGNITSFKKGNIPHNHRPIGSTRICSKEGYLLVKVSEPNKWKAKHILVWEALNGPVPKGKAVMFLDRDKMNFNLDNLILVSHAERLIMNRKHLVSHDPNLTKAGKMVAGIVLLTAKRERLR